MSYKATCALKIRVILHPREDQLPKFVQVKIRKINGKLLESECEIIVENFEVNRHFPALVVAAQGEISPDVRHEFDV